MRPPGAPVPAAGALIVALLAGSCSTSSTPSTIGPYPPPPHVLAMGVALPDLSFPGVDEDGRPRTIALHEFVDEGPRAGVLVVRIVGGAWCGTCRWHAAHGDELRALPSFARLRFLDVLLGDEDNHPARPEDAARWQALSPASARVPVAVDPAFTLRPLVGSEGLLLPHFVFVDARTMKVIGQVSNPDPLDLGRRIESLMASLDGRAPPTPPAEALIDGLFHRNEWDLIAGITRPGAPPADPTNSVADDRAAAALGKALFADTGLSPSGKVACASCHDPKQELSDGRPRALGVGEGLRRTPTLALAAHARWQTWDGHADTLWAQALGPLEEPTEMDSSRLFVAHRVLTAHAERYAAAFPGSPPDLAKLPLHGKPGQPSFDGLAADDRESVTRVFVNAGKAIAAYERTFRLTPSRLDAYVEGDREALAPLEKLGLATFVRVGCMQCHWGPRLTDDAFHNTRAPGHGLPDRGRLDGVLRLQRSEFLASSVWSDDRTARDASRTFASPSLLGAFRTRTLRGVASAAPYGHAGALGELSTVTETYGTGGVPLDDPRAVGVAEPWVAPFGVTSQWALVPFLETLSERTLVP